jgi:energy-coupling factor transport system permease protein
LDPLLLFGENIFSLLLFLFGLAAPLVVLLTIIGLTGLREVTRYEKNDTIYYRLSPITKIGLVVTITAVAAVTTWWVGLFLSLGTLATYLSLKEGKRKFALGSFICFSSTIGLLWSEAPIVPYTFLEYAVYGVCVTNLSNITNLTPVWTWPQPVYGHFLFYIGYQPVLTQEAFYYGLQIAVRVLAPTVASLILIMTSTPSDVLRALRKIKMPVQIIFALVVAMRTVPRIFDALNTAVRVQFMRGYGVNASRPAKLFYMAGAALTGIVPAMAFLFRGARNTAISADTRAFRAFKDRTYLKPVTFSRADYLMWGIIALMVVFAVVANFEGFGRSIYYAALGSSCQAPVTG